MRENIVNWNQNLSVTPKIAFTVAIFSSFGIQNNHAINSILFYNVVEITKINAYEAQ